MAPGVDAEALAASGDAMRTVTAEGECVARLSNEAGLPFAVENLYFGYMLMLCAVKEAAERLRATDYGVDVNGNADGGHGSGADSDVRALLDEVLASPLVLDEGVQVAQQNLQRHAVEAGGALLWQARIRSRDLMRIMDCVQCNVCRLHGKVGR